MADSILIIETKHADGIETFAGMALFDLGEAIVRNASGEAVAVTHSDTVPTYAVPLLSAAELEALDAGRFAFTIQYIDRQPDESNEALVVRVWTEFYITKDRMLREWTTAYALTGGRLPYIPREALLNG